MTIYDISVPITSNMPVWPGDSGVKITQESNIDDGDNANVSHLSLGAHTGTHVDAPVHFIPGGESLEKVPLEYFIGSVQVIEFLDVDLITLQALEAENLQFGCDRILLKTRNSTLWTLKEHPFQEDYVALSPDAARYLVRRKYCLVGIDYLSIAPFGDSRPTHEILLSGGIVILEGINLAAVSPGFYTLYCLPLNLLGVDGAPARAVLIEE
jgi:arylformamidase